MTTPQEHNTDELDKETLELLSHYMGMYADAREAEDVLGMERNYREILALIQSDRNKVLTGLLEKKQSVISDIKIKAPEPADVTVIEAVPISEIQQLIEGES